MHQPQHASEDAPQKPRSRRRRIALLALVGATSSALAIFNHQRAARTWTFPAVREHDAAWVDARLQAWKQAPAETLDNVGLWETQASTALAKAKQTGRLMFVVSTHGDVVTGRI